MEENVNERRDTGIGRKARGKDKKREKKLKVRGEKRKERKKGQRRTRKNKACITTSRPKI